MNVRTIRSCLVRQGYPLPSGSLLQNVKEFSRSYRGVWSSMSGSFVVTVPKDACEKERTDAPK